MYIYMYINTHNRLYNADNHYHHNMFVSEKTLASINSVGHNYTVKLTYSGSSN